MTQNLELKTNNLLKLTFQGNAHSDNVAYWLDYNNFVQSTNIFHEKYAHVWPELADSITDIMIKENIRPVRMGLDDEIENFNNITDVFEDVKSFWERYETFLKETIDLADLEDEYGLKIFLEDFLFKRLNFKKQVRVWLEKAKEYQLKENFSQFDKNFSSFTFI